MRSNFPEQTAAVMGGGEKKGPIKEQLDYLDYFDDDHDEDEDDEEIAPLDAMESARKKKMSLYCPTGKGSEVGTGGRRRVSVSAAVINADSVAKQKVLGPVKGEGEVIVLGLEVVGTQVTYFANGEKVGSRRFDAKTVRGEIGLFGQDVEAEYSTLRVRY